jgi:hypothetical protein
MKSLARRVKSLEASAAARTGGAVGLDQAAEFDWWAWHLERAGDLLGPAADAHIDGVVEFFRGELVNLPYLSHLHGRGEGAAWLGCFRRMPRAMLALLRRLPPDLRPGACDALATTRGWAHGWAHGLAWLDWRLPPDLDPEVLRAVLTWTAGRRPGIDDFCGVCVGCGFRRPPAPPAGGPGCPHCGEAVAVGRVGDQPFAWQDAARAELDPVLDRGGRPRPPGD